MMNQNVSAASSRRIAFRIAFLLTGTNKKYTERNRFPFNIHPGFEQLEPGGFFLESPYNSFGLKNCFMFTVLAFNIKIFDIFPICVSPPLSMKEAAKIMHICSVIIYPLEKTIHCIGTSSICNKQHPDSGCFGISGVVIS